MEQSLHRSLEFDNLCDLSAPIQCDDQLTSVESSVSKHAIVPPISSVSVIEELENRLAVGQVMKSIEDTYLLYCTYAHAKGFSVRKGDQCYFSGSTEIQAKEFECSCEGTKDERCSTNRVPGCQKSVPRTKCKARLRIGREKGGEWKVTRFVMEHNHEMVAADQTHLLRSSRNISHAQKSTLEALINAGIPVAGAISYMEEEAQGESSMSEHATAPPVSSVIEGLENKLAVGQVMKSIEDTYLLYCTYAHAKGFSVRKGDQCYFTGTTEIQAKEFECSCEGTKDERCSTNRVPVYQKSVTRTKCKARLRIGRERGGEWKVTRFVMEHNHEMVAADQTHRLRSSRNISHAQKSTLEALINAGIPVASAISYMEGEAQRAKHLGFTQKDLKRHTKIENGDAIELMQYFLMKSNNEPFFYWNMQVDDENKVMNFFFRDHQCKVDFEYFGDVLLVDTTYRTIKHDLICAPFVGINHHRQNVIFGLAFMSDDSESSFAWLFKTFLESMDGKQPETIFTDQCQAMMNAVDTVFPLAHHRLCHWHINHNAPSHLGSLNDDSSFKQLWNKCMQYCESEEEFEVTWRNMIDKYNLSGHSWLNGMYNLRHRWATAFSNKKFSAGLLATSRSAGTSSVLEEAGNRATSLYSFVLNYETIQHTWRANEKLEDTRCRHGKPATILKNNPLLDHGADVYTLNILHMFQEELLESVNLEFIEKPSPIGHLPIIFKMKSYGQDSEFRTVVFDEQKEEIECSCHKFESMGILCRHVLKVFNFMGVRRIPEMYIKGRWTKNARYRLSCKGHGCESGSGNGNDYASEMVFVNQKMRLAYDLVMQCKAHAELRNILTECFDSTVEKIQAFLENSSSNELTRCNNLVFGDDNNQISVEEHISNSLSVESRGIPLHWDQNNKRARNF